MVGASVAAFLEPSRQGRHMGGKAWSPGCHASWVGLGTSSAEAGSAEGHLSPGCQLSVNTGIAALAWGQGAKGTKGNC